MNYGTFGTIRECPHSIYNLYYSLAVPFFKRRTLSSMFCIVGILWPDLPTCLHPGNPPPGVTSRLFGEDSAPPRSGSNPGCEPEDLERLEPPAGLGGHPCRLPVLAQRVLLLLHLYEPVLLVVGDDEAGYDHGRAAPLHEAAQTGRQAGGRHAAK